jgi:hypothetical protein
MSSYYGNFSTAQTVRIEFNTVNSSGVPTTLSSGTVAILKAGSVVVPSGGVTLTIDSGSITGYNTVVIDMSVDTTVFATGNDFSVRLAGTSNVGGTSVVGVVVGEFAIGNRSMNLNFAQTLIGSPTTGTVGNALVGAEAQSGGKWTIVGSTLTVYRGDNTTIFRTFTLNDPVNPTQRV